MENHTVSYPVQLQTDRLLLRRWRDADREPFSVMNTDPQVMEYYRCPLTVGQSNSMIDRIESTFDEEGLGLWAVEIPGDASFIGYVGLWPALFPAPFTPAVEVGWRIGRRYWNCGYATEAATAAVADGFARVGLAEIVSFTAVINHRSRRVMERLGMTHDSEEDFDHPNVEVGHQLRRQVLYRLKAPLLPRDESTVP
jgi:RimJ/RimL family protein N-acetyltransferase